MIQNIPLFILLEKLINFIIHLIHTWFDLLFPYVVFDDNTDKYSIITKYSYNNTIFSYGYNYHIDNQLVPIGFYICKIKDTYFMITHRIGKKNEFCIRHLNLFNRDFTNLINDINDIIKYKENRNVYGMNIYGNIYLITNIIKPNKYVNKYLINKIKDIYYTEIGSRIQNKNAAFLLYGKPGSGKTTNISALSYLLNMDVHYITIDDLSPRSIHLLYHKKNVILLFEDWFPNFINEYFTYKQNYKTDKDFSTFINLISGITSTKNCIFIFTCNSTKEIFNEKQIYPLFRNGRVDHIFNVEKNIIKYQKPVIKNGTLSFI